MEKHLRFAVTLTKLLDNQFKIGPFTFGLDPLLGWIPGIGDILTVTISLYLLWIGYELKLPRVKLLKMLANLSLDFVLGLVPIVGDIGDFFYKANLKNLEIIQKHKPEAFEEGEIVEEEVIGIQ